MCELRKGLKKKSPKGRGREKRIAQSYRETFRGVKDKQESSLWSSTPQAPLCKQRVRADCKRFAQSARPGSEKGPLLELFYTIGRVSGVIFGSFFDHWEHFGSAGSPSLITKAAWAIKGAPSGATPKVVSFLGSI